MFNVHNTKYRCQEVFLNNMRLPPNVARNSALRENVFMMVVCIELKIPLFLVGKPGSSKSLAKSVVSDSMQGSASPSMLFQIFKQVPMYYILRFVQQQYFLLLQRFNFSHINAASIQLQNLF